MSRNVKDNEIWRKIRCIQGIHHPNVITINCNNVLTSNPDKVANSFADSFHANFQPSFGGKATPAPTSPAHSRIGPEDIKALNLPFTAWELATTLDSLCNTAPGPDNIHNLMLKNLSPESKHTLLKIHNKIYNTGKIPSEWKMAMIVPLQKPGRDTTSIKNYRPISLISSLGKTLESMVNKRLNWLIEKHHLISDNQGGFRKGRSTIDLIHRLEQDIQEALRNKEHVVAIFLDIEKAYDSTSHDLVTKTLTHWGIHGAIFDYVKDFLSNRSFYVRVGNCTSRRVALSSGLPQGSTLSPTLFNIAISNMSSLTHPPVKTLYYADDIVLYIRGKYLKSLQSILQHTLNKMSDWLNSNNFRISMDKMKCIDFKRHRDYEIPKLILGNREIPVVDSCSFLGMVMDSKLTWTPHIRELKQRCQKSLQLLRAVGGTRWGADRSTLLKLFQAIVQSKIDYGCTIYMTANKKTLNLIDSTHNEGLRIVTGAFRTSPITSLHVETGILPPDLRRKLLGARYQAKIMENDKHPNNLLVRRWSNLTASRHYNFKHLSSGERVAYALDSMEVHLSQILGQSGRTTPPWLLVDAPCDLSLLNQSKTATPDGWFIQQFKMFLGNHNNHTIIYTDGSKSAEGTGAGIVCDTSSQGIGLPKDWSSFTAEAYAIWRALLLFPRPSNMKIIICTDSLSSLQALQDKNSSNHYIHKTQELATHLTKHYNTDISYKWVPGHKNILGNESADKIARHAAKQQPSLQSVTKDDMIAKINLAFRSKWRADWETTTNNKLRSLKADIKPWPSSIRPSRREEVVLCRARLGHSSYTHGYIMNRKDRPKCEFCNNAETSFSHIFEECTAIRNCKPTQLKNKLLHDCLGDNHNLAEASLRFLRDIGIYHKI